MSENRELDHKMERDLVGGLMLNPMNIEQVSMMTCGADFSDPLLGRVFDHLVVMKEAGKPFMGNITVLFSELSSAGIQVEKAELAKWLKGSTGTANEYQAGQVHERSLQRKLGTLGLNMAEQANANEADSQEIINFVNANIEQMRQSEGDPITPVSDAIDELIEDLSRPVEDGSSIQFGINILDEEIGKVMGGEVMVIAGRPGKGKTALALQVAGNVVETGKPVLVVSLEMQRKELAKRSLCQEGKMDSEQARFSGCSEKELEQLKTQALRLKESGLFFWAPPRATVAQVSAVAKICKAKHGLGLLVIDYLQLLRGASKDDLRTRISENSRAIKALAKELNVPVIALAQLNRMADHEEPNLSHLAESSAIEQDADSVVMIGTKRAEKGDHLALFVAKNRHGETGCIPITFHGNRTLFVSEGFEPAPDSRHEVSTYKFPNAS